MRITHKAYTTLLKCPHVPPETGGVIGGHGDIIDSVMFDPSSTNHAQTCYTPDAKFLNQRIKEWASVGVQWFGLFHTHATQWPSLSNADIDYIRSIVVTVLNDGEALLFPLIFPERSIRWYLATKTETDVYISEEIIEIEKEI